jgi:iron(III) transport system substrate-binding protein
MKQMPRTVSLAFCALIAVSAGCQRPNDEVVVYTSVDQPFSEPIFRAFEQRSGIATRVVYDTEETKSTGVLNRLLAEADSPQADVFLSGDSVRPFVLMERGLVEPYVSPATADIPSEFKAADGSWTGGAARARILLVNRGQLASNEMPTSIRDLANPLWKARTAMANPLFGTTTMHVAAIFDVWGEDRARAFLSEVKANDVRIASSNGEVRRLVAAGEVAFGLTDTDDANEAIKDGADVAVVYPDQAGDGTLVVPTSVVLLKGPNRDNGRRLVDFLVSPDVERMLAESAAHMPLRSGLPSVPGMRGVAEIRAMKADYARIGHVMQAIQPWLREWAGL